MNNIILYTSLEPCPMCLARIIAASITFWWYVPPVWQEIGKNSTYQLADCPKPMQQLVSEILLTSKQLLDNKLKKE